MTFAQNGQRLTYPIWWIFARARATCNAEFARTMKRRADAEGIAPSMRAGPLPPPPAAGYNFCGSIPHKLLPEVTREESRSLP